MLVLKKIQNEFSKLRTNTFGIALYDVITYSNGEILLVQLTAEKENGEYRVVGVVRMPAEMKKLSKK